jgi:predicted nucleic acid-binding protein
MVARTKRYITHLADKNEQIMIPAPVLTEYLMHFEVAEQEKQREVIQKNFIVPAFDVRASVVAAELQGNTELIKRILASGELDKIKLRTDAQIIATAIVNQADKIISHDLHFAKLAQGRISVAEVPVIQIQMDMEFED